MAYSRWLNSKWYIFWHTSNAKTKEEEELALWYVKSSTEPVFTYEQLLNVNTPQDLRNILGMYIPDDECEEALKWIRVWREEVEEEYKEETE